MTDHADQRPDSDEKSEIDPGREDARGQAARARDRETQPPSSQGTGASGGYGVGSGESSGGSGEPPAGGDRDRATTADEQTEWLRSAPGGSDEPVEGPRNS